MINREYGGTIADSLASTHPEDVYTKSEPESPLVGAFEYQRMTIDRLDNSIARLEGRLKALLISFPEDRSIAKEGDSRPRSLFTEGLSANNRQLDSAVDRIDLIISSLDV